MISIQNQDESTNHHNNKHTSHIFASLQFDSHTPRFKSQWFEEVCAVLREAAILEGGMVGRPGGKPGRTSEDFSNKRETFWRLCRVNGNKLNTIYST